MARQRAEGQAALGRSRGWAALGWFWAAALSCLVTGAVVLQMLGPPPVAAPAPVPAPAAPAPAPASDQSAGIPAPIAALQEANAPADNVPLPRTAADGRMPTRTCVVTFDAAAPVALPTPAPQTARHVAPATAG
jgi:hypothetical protein